MRLLVRTAIITVWLMSSAAVSHVAASPKIQEMSLQLELILKESISPARDVRLQRFIKKNFNFRKFESKVLVDSKDKFSKEQRATFSKAFRKLMTSHLIAVINRELKDVQEHQYQVTQDKSGNDVKVTYQLKGRSYEILFHLIPQTQTKGIEDITVSGALLSRNYRGTINKIVRRDGVEVLIEKILSRTQTPLIRKGLI